MKNITDVQHQKLSREMREILAVYKEAEDLINIGAYKQGANPKIDRAIGVYDQIIDFLRQDVEDASNLSKTLSTLKSILR